jgi:hypothetical protein
MPLQLAVNTVPDRSYNGDGLDIDVEPIPGDLDGEHPDTTQVWYSPLASTTPCDVQAGEMIRRYLA